MRTATAVKVSAAIPAGTTCRAPVGPCDIAEVCDGSSPQCPPDALAPEGTPCVGEGTCLSYGGLSGVCVGAAGTCVGDEPGLVFNGIDYASCLARGECESPESLGYQCAADVVLRTGCDFLDVEQVTNICTLLLPSSDACDECFWTGLTDDCTLCVLDVQYIINDLTDCSFYTIAECLGECAPTEYLCADGLDNDCDGFVDGDDSDCEAACVPSDEICDGVDNDCDGVIDNPESAHSSCDDGNACTGQYCWQGACVNDEDPWACGEPRVFDCSPGVDPPCSTKEDLTGSDLTLAELTEEDLSGVDFTGSTFLNANLERANLMEAILASCTFQGANLNWANLSGADVSYATFSGADLGGASLISATVEGTDFSTADLSSADLTALDLSGLNFSGADLGGARLEYANLGGADLNAADLNAAHLANANLSVADLREASLINADLSYSDLSGAALEDANFQRANLEGATLRNLDLSGYAGWTDFTDARLVDVDAVGFELQRRKFRNADLSGSNFSGASLLVRLINAVLLDAVLVGADLSGSDLRAADLSTADLSGANLAFASYNTDTKFPPLFDPVAAGMTEVSCISTEVYEESCRDGLDNDCNGYVDSEDAHCGL